MQVPPDPRPSLIDLEAFETYWEMVAHPNHGKIADLIEYGWLEHAQSDGEDYYRITERGQRALAERDE